MLQYKPFISVIIPCYNQGIFLSDAVYSIIKQSYKNLEIIIVNDGSDDNTIEIAEQIIRENPQIRIKLISKKRQDVAAARNTGIEEASGEWILPLDSDDLFEQSFLEKAVAIIIKNPELNMISARLESFGNYIKEWDPPPYNHKNILNSTTFIYATLFKKELVLRAGYYDPSLPWGAEDWELWLRFHKYGIKSYIINEKLFFYRFHSQESKTVNMMPRHPQVKAMLKTMHPDLFSKAELQSCHKIISGIDIQTLKVLEQKIITFPDLPLPYFWLGLYYEENQKFDTAISYFEQFLNLKEDWQAFYRLSIIYKNIGNLTKASESFLSYKNLLSKTGSSRSL